jgi:prepilin-type N-terminal cleavage/methylation domain-containing protein
MNNPLPSKRRRLAFTLTEMLAVVLLLSVFSVIVAELFVVTVRTQREAYRREALLQRLDAALSYIRRDTWTATAIDADGPTVRLPSARGPVVTWKYTQDGKLTRTAEPGKAEQTWGDLPPVAFSARGPLLTLTLKAMDREESVTFFSQQMEGSK